MTDITQDQVMRNWKSLEPLVSISCITYNHAPYISQTLDGFLMQKTDFAFEILIHDDASPDGTADIIREYEAKFPKLIKPIYQKENQYSHGKTTVSATWNFPRVKGKYVALCEGDDYWIDENKLQMQVDFLEKNPDCGLCYTQAKQFVQKTGKVLRQKFGYNVKGFEDLLYNGNRIPTLTTVFRASLWKKYIEEINSEEQKWLMGDYPLWLYFSHESKVHFIEKPTAMYRILENSASHSSDIKKQAKFMMSYEDIREFFAKKYELNFTRPSVNGSLIYYCLDQKNYKACRTIEISDLGLKLKIIKLTSFVPPAFLFVCWLRGVYGEMRRIIVDNDNSRTDYAKKE